MDVHEYRIHENLCPYEVRLPENTLEQFRLAVYVAGKTQQRIVNDLFLEFASRILNKVT